MSVSDDERRKKFTSKKLDFLKAASFDWRHIDDYTLRVLSVFAHHINWKTERTKLSDDKIVLLAGRHRQTAQGARRKARDLGWLTWRRTKTANVYTLGFAKAAAVLAAFKREQDKRQKANEDTGNEAQMSRQDDISPDVTPGLHRDVTPGRHLKPEMSSRDSIEMESQDSTYTYRGTPKGESENPSLPSQTSRSGASLLDAQPLTRLSEFEQFWILYPRKVGKGHAREAFAKALKKTTVDVVLAALAAQKETKAWNDPRFIKHPTTWLNGECWDDTPEDDTLRDGKSRSMVEAMDKILQREIEQEAAEIKNGTRLPAHDGPELDLRANEWRPSDNVIRFGLDRGMSRDEIEHKTERFRCTMGDRLYDGRSEDEVNDAFRMFLKNY